MISGLTPASLAESINPVKGHRLREILDKIQWPLKPEPGRSDL